MIALGVYQGRKAYKKHQKKKEEKKRLEALEVPPVIDQSGEFEAGRTSTSSSAQSRPVEGGPVNYAESSSSRYSSTASEPNSTIDRTYAASTRSSEYELNTASSIASSEDYRKYQQYVERQSSAYLKDGPVGPPAYQAAISSPPAQGAPRGKWIFVPADDEIIDPNNPPTMPPPPRSPFRAANELPAAVPAAAYASPTAAEIQGDMSHTQFYDNDMAKSKAPQRFELPADEPTLKRKKSTSSDSDEEMVENSSEIKRYELL